MILSLVLLPTVFSGASMSAVDATPDVQQRYRQWERRLRDKVADQNFLPASAFRDPACNVVVGFTVGQDQRPDDVEVVNSSCGAFYDRQAQRLVLRLGRVGQVPSASGKNYRVLLNLTYGQAPDPVADRSLTDALEAERQFHSRRNVEIVTAKNHLADIGQRGAD